MARTYVDVHGGAFAPLLVKAISELFTPKDVQKQRQRQLALEAMAQLQPMVSNLPDEEKPKFYSQFFKAYGMYEPPLMRRIGGAVAEPVIPLPAGGKEINLPIVGPFGMGKVTRRTAFVPEPEPFKFAKPPLLYKQEEEELERLYPDEEERAEARENIIERRTGQVWPKSAAGMEQKMVDRAEKLIQKDMEANNLYREDAIERLPESIKRRYKSYLQKLSDEELQREAVREELASKGVAREEATKIAKDRQALAEAIERRKVEYQNWYYEYKERMLDLKEKLSKQALKGKNAPQVYRDMLAAYTVYSDSFDKERDAWIKQEALFAKGKPGYEPIRFPDEKKTVDEWKITDGAVFWQRILKMESGEEGRGGVTPSPEVPSQGGTPEQRLKEKWPGLFPKSPPKK